MGSIVFSPLAQGMLTTKYLKAFQRIAALPMNHFLKRDFIRPEIIDNTPSSTSLPKSVARPWRKWPFAWVLRGGRVTSALVGASRVSQIEDCVKALDNLTFTDAELAEINTYAKEADINLWAKSA